MADDVPSRSPLIAGVPLRARAFDYAWPFPVSILASGEAVLNARGQSGKEQEVEAVVPPSVPRRRPARKAVALKSLPDAPF